MDQGTGLHIHAHVIRAGVNDGECSIRADERGLVIDREEIPRAKLVGAVTEHLGPGDASRVSIVKRDFGGLFSTVSIVTSSRDNALELIRALGLSPERGALSATVAQPAQRFDFAVFVAITLVAFLAAFALSIVVFRADEGADPFRALMTFAITSAAVLLSHRILFRARVMVGVDGVTIRTWRSRKYFAYENVREVTMAPQGPALVLGAEEVVPVAAFFSYNGIVTVGELLYRRIWQAHLAHSELCKKRSTIDDVQTLGARTWVRTLRENPEGRAVDYRTPGRTLPHLEDAVVDATQPLQVRVGAAIGLRAKDGASAEKRIRAAASASASPKLRVLFERIAEDASDEELATRIEQLT